MYAVGAANTIQQVIRTRLLDELYLHVTPMVPGRGERLLENIDHPKLIPVEVVGSPSVNHIRYRIKYTT